MSITIPLGTQNPNSSYYEQAQFDIGSAVGQTVDAVRLVIASVLQLRGIVVEQQVKIEELRAEVNTLRGIQKPLTQSQPPAYQYIDVRSGGIILTGYSRAVSNLGVTAQTYDFVPAPAPAPVQQTYKFDYSPPQQLEYPFQPKSPTQQATIQPGISFTPQPDSPNTPIFSQSITFASDNTYRPSQPITFASGNTFRSFTDAPLEPHVSPPPGRWTPNMSPPMTPTRSKSAQAPSPHKPPAPRRLQITGAEAPPPFSIFRKPSIFSGDFPDAKTFVWGKA